MTSSTFAGLRALRTEAGLSQDALAELTGIRQATISEWERGAVVRIELTVIDALCAVLSKKLKRSVTLAELRKKPK